MGITGLGDELRAAFDEFDGNGSGTIDIPEFMQVAVKLGILIPREEMARLVAEIDADGSGEIDFTEFVQARAHASVCTQPSASVCSRALLAPCERVCPTIP